MNNLKTTPEERAGLRQSLSYVRELGHADLALRILDDLDTLAARVAKLESAIVQIREHAYDLDGGDRDHAQIFCTGESRCRCDLADRKALYAVLEGL